MKAAKTTEKTTVIKNLYKAKMTKDEFLEFTLLHQKRVKNLGLHLFEEFSSQLPQVNKDLVCEFLSLHDHSKTIILPDGTEQIEMLYQFYGINKSEASESEKYQILSTINHINYMDAQKALGFFNDHKLIDHQGELKVSAHDLLALEKVADMVDRGLCSHSPHEFNRKLKPASILLKDPTLVQYALYLEQHYQQIVSSLKKAK